MGYFDGLADACFKTDAQGGTLFYKWGVLGKAHIMPNPEKTAEIRRFVLLYYKVSLPLIIIAGALLKWYIAGLLAIPLIIWFLTKTSALTKGLPVSEEKLTLRESYTNSARTHNKFTLWLLLTVSLLFVLLGIMMLFSAKDFKAQLIGAGGLIFFGACSAAFIYMLKVKR